LRIFLFSVRALRRTLRMAIRLRKAPTVVEVPQAPRTLEDADLETSLQKVLERLFDGRFKDVRHSRDLLRGVRQLLEADTDRPLEKDLALKDEQIQMLEQKIRRLAALLKENERQRELVRAAAQVKFQFVSGMGAMTPGVKSGDPKRKVKLDLMREIRALNREIRGEVKVLVRSSSPQAPYHNEGEVFEH
jgi:flagellar motility protein MotE (MotC chaperone)